MDHTTRKKDVTRYLKDPSGVRQGPTEDIDQFNQISIDGPINQATIGQQETFVSAKTINQEDQIQNFGIGGPNKSVVVGGEEYYDPIRETSGKNLPRKNLPLTLDSKCINHNSSNHDRALTLKLFKTACLAYEPSHINYREMTLDRAALIKMRRRLIDQVTNILPNCDIFKEKAFYPRKYFDDLMLENKQIEE